MRRRPVALAEATGGPNDAGAASTRKARKRVVGTPLFPVLLVLVLLAATRYLTPFSSFQSLLPTKIYPTSPPQVALRAVTQSELAQHVGQPAGSPIWISILGEVFDVTPGARHYGPDGGYHFFAGRDATRAFHTGDFIEEGLIDSVGGLSDSAMLSLHEWAQFYRGEKSDEENQYKRVGFLVGGYWYLEEQNEEEKDGKDQNYMSSTSQGSYTPRPTDGKRAFDAAVARALLQKKSEAARASTFPACASRWSSEKGGEVWCADSRLRPRKEVTFVAGKRRVRCACFPDDSFSDVRQLYPGCKKNSARCATG